MLDFDFSKIPYDDLTRMEKAVQKEKERRQDLRFTELVNQFCDAYNALKREFPYAELELTMECPDCGGDETFNVFDRFERLAPSMVSRS